MKVIYKDKLSDKIIKLVYQTESDNKDIEYIVLGPEEWEELTSEVPAVYKSTYIPNSILGTFLGITIVGTRYHENKLKGIK